MFSNAYQSGFISLFFSVGSSPLVLWDKQVKNGHIRRVIDDEVKSLVLEIGGTNVATTYITCPIKPRASLGITLPFLVMVIKNMKKYFTFEIQILDDKDMRRRFRVSNFQSTTKVSPFCTTMPIGLSCGWNQVQFNLADFCKRAYGSTYLETVRVQIHANVRIRRIYFTDHLATEEDMPNEFKLFGPGKGKKAAEDEKGATVEKPPEDVPPLPSPVEEGRPEGELGGAPPTPTSPLGDVPAEQAGEPAEVTVAEEGVAGPPEEGAAEAGAVVADVQEGPPPTEGEAGEAPEAPAEAGEAAPAEAGAPEGEAPVESEAGGEAAPPTEAVTEETKTADETAPTETSEAAPTETETTEATTEAVTTEAASEAATSEPPPSESAPTEEPPTTTDNESPEE